MPALIFSGNYYEDPSGAIVLCEDCYNFLEEQPKLKPWVDTLKRRTLGEKFASAVCYTCWESTEPPDRKIPPMNTTIVSSAVDDIKISECQITWGEDVSDTHHKLLTEVYCARVAAELNKAFPCASVRHEIQEGFSGSAKITVWADGIVVIVRGRERGSVGPIEHREYIPVIEGIKGAVWQSVCEDYSTICQG